MQFWGVAAKPMTDPPGHCTACGYDLTGNTSGVCPECGKTVPDQSSPETLRHAETE